MTLQHNLAAFVDCGLRRVHLGEDVLTGNILIHHPVNGLELSDNFLQSAVQIVRIHTLSHTSTSRK